MFDYSVIILFNFSKRIFIVNIFQQMKIYSFIFISTIFLILTNSQDTPADNPQTTATNYGEQVLAKELRKKQQVGLHYGHIQTYSFNVKYTEQFIITVQTDQTIKAQLQVYWDQDDTYVQSKYQVGEQVRLLIYQNRRVVIVNQIFYHAYGFSFEAKKGNEYLLRFFKAGKQKLVILHIENYLKEGKAQNVLNTDIINQHELKTRKVEESVRSYLGLIEMNSVINEQIAANVQLHTKRYMMYQIVETILVIVASIGQIYFIRKLLSNSSVV